MNSGGERWLDREAGPVVRAYALTRGRTRPLGHALDVVDVVTAVIPAPTETRWIGPEQQRLLELCRAPMAVADLASETDLALGVVRVLLSDLCQQGMVSVVKVPPGGTPDVNILRTVLDGLRAL